MGTVDRIHVASESGAPVQPRDSVVAVEGRGLEGDRYFQDEGTFANRNGSEVTFIEMETLDAVERDYEIELETGVHRRNITTSAISLNHLVDTKFRVGNAICRGEELCEPCAYLEKLLDKNGVRDALVHRGGLRASILETGEILIGDEIHPL